MITNRNGIGGADTADPEPALQDAFMRAALFVEDPVATASRLYDYTLFQSPDLAVKIKK